MTLRPFILVALLALSTGHGPAFAQSADVGTLSDRIDQLQRDLSLLQRQVYRNNVEAPPPSSGAAPSGGSAPPPAILDSLQQTQDQMTHLTGQIEEINHKVEVLSQRLDKLSQDIDARFNMMKQGGGGPPAAPAPEAAPPAASDQPEPTPGAKSPGVLTLPKGAGGETAPPAEEKKSGKVLPPGTPKSQYNHAFSLLQSGDYAKAEAAFKEFVAAYPNDSLNASAQYWLAETYFVRDDYDRAASTFLSSYRKAPKGPKAGEDLVKLGQCLSKLNKKKAACASFAKFENDFPDASKSLKQRAAAEAKKAGCAAE